MAVCGAAGRAITEATAAEKLSRVHVHRRGRRRPRRALARPATVDDDALKLDQSDSYHLFLSHTWVTAADKVRVIKERLAVLLVGIRVFLDTGE